MSDAPTPKTDAILALIPGGQTCDPQLVADELRPKIAEMERELAAERETTQRLYDRLERREGYLCDYKVAYADERALADRLVGAIEEMRDLLYLHGLGCHAGCDSAREALAAWKASRDPNNLEGAGPTEDERRENARAIQAMSFPERIDLMFRGKEGGES